MQLTRSTSAISVIAVTSAALGQAWTPIDGPPGGLVQAVASVDRQTIAGVDGGLFGSSDGGGRWSLLAPAPASVVEMVAMGDRFFITTRDGRIFRTDGVAGAFVASPRDHGIVQIGVDADGQGLFTIAAGTTWSAGELFTSDDAGDSWQPVATPNEIAAAYKAGDTLLAAESFGRDVLRSTDGGRTWVPVGSASGLPEFIFVTGFAGRGDTVLATYSDFTGRAGAVLSHDLGETWTGASTGLIARNVLDAELTDGHVILATQNFERTAIDIWRLPLAGGTWTLVAESVEQHSQPEADLARDGDALLLATNTRGVLRSLDQGLTWEPANDGLTVSTATTMAADADQIVLATAPSGDVWRFDHSGGWQAVAFPSALGDVRTIESMGDSAFLAGTEAGGVRVSTDGGRTWRSANSGVPRYDGLGGSQLREFDAFAARGDTWLGAGGSGAEWPPPGPKGAAAVETGGGGVIRSTDGAASWQHHTTGLPVVSRAPDGRPHYPAALSLMATSDAFYMGTKGNGIFRSLDDGRSWTASSSGLPTAPWTGVAAIVALAEFQGSMYAASSDHAVGQTLFRSTDRGISWSPVDAVPHAPTLSLRVHDGRLVAGMGPILSGPEAGVGGGVWATSDGIEWNELGEGLNGRQVRGLASLGGVLHAGTIGLGVWAFDDACPVDLDGDGELTIFDFLAFSNLFDDGDPRADFNGDGTLDLFDFLAFQTAFDAGCD